VPGYYEQNHSRPIGSDMAETGNEGRNTTSSTEASSVDIVHVDVTAVTNPCLNPSLMLPSVTQLDLVSVPIILRILHCQSPCQILMSPTQLMHLLFWWRY